MNDQILRIREQNRLNKEEAQRAKRHNEALTQIAQLERSFAESIRSLAEYLGRTTTKTEVVNQLKEIATPDALKVMSAVNDMHGSLKKLKNTDLTEVTKLLSSMADELAKIPKSHPDLPEAKDSVEVSNLSSLGEYFTKLESAIDKLTSKETPAPVVNVPAPRVDVQAPIVNVEQDFKVLKKGLSDVVEAIKAQVLPETNLNTVEKSLEEANKKLQKLVDKPVGGGGGSGGHSTPYQDANNKPTYVNVEGGAVPTTAPAQATRLDDTTTANTIYIGKAPIGSAITSAVWQIAKLDTSSGLVKTWAGNAGFTQIWDNRASLTYE